MANQVTEQVSMWVNNDSDVYFVAQNIARDGDLETLKEYLLGVIREAQPNSAAWYVGYNHAPRELECEVDWREVADDLTSE